MTDAAGATDATMQELPSEECYRLLATQEIGRLGVNAEHYPLTIPVNYGLDGTTIVIRTHLGTTLRAAVHANVTFEVDDSTGARAAAGACWSAAWRKSWVRSTARTWWPAPGHPA